MIGPQSEIPSLSKFSFRLTTSVVNQKRFKEVMIVFSEVRGNDRFSFRRGRTKTQRRGFDDGCRLVIGSIRISRML